MTAAARPILKIDLDDSAFEQFQQKFSAYQGALAETAESWDEIGKGPEAADFDKLNEFIEKHQRAMDRVANDRRLEERARKLSDAWYTVNGVATKFSSNVLKASRSLAKWAGITSVFSSLFAAGGLMGIGHVAANAARDRFSANELGVSFGEREGFAASFGRLGNTDAILEWVGRMQKNPEDRWSLGAIMGSTGDANRLSGMGTADAAVELLPQAQRRAKAAPAAALDQVAKTFGIPVELARVLRNMSPAELQELIARYRGNQSAMALPPGVLRKWNDLNTKFDEAEATIESAFVNKLVKLVPSFDKFSQAATRLIDKFLQQGGPLEKALGPINKGLDWLAERVSSRDFESTVDETIEQVSRFCVAIMRLTGTTISGFGAGTGGSGGTSGGSGGGTVPAPAGGGGNPPAASAPTSAHDKGSDAGLGGGRRGFAMRGRQGGPGFGASANPYPETGKAGDERFSVTGHAASAGVQNVDKDLVEANREASKYLPPGYRVEMYSGYRPGDPRFHGKGMAADFAIIDDKGRRLSNYQTPENFRTYEDFAQHAHRWLLKNHPDKAARHRFGGYFGGRQGAGGTYGANDIMHQDMGGTAMAAGSWEKGLNKGYRGVFDSKEHPSVGMAEQKFDPKTTTSPPVPPVADRTFLPKPAKPDEKADKVPAPPWAEETKRSIDRYKAEHPEYYPKTQKTSALHHNTRHWQRESKVAKVDLSLPHGMVVA